MIHEDSSSTAHGILLWLTLTSICDVNGLIFVDTLSKVPKTAKSLLYPCSTKTSNGCLPFTNHIAGKPTLNHKQGRTLPKPIKAVPFVLKPNSLPLSGCGVLPAATEARGYHIRYHITQMGAT